MNQKMTMKELPISERPYEKCEELGPEALSDAELLAVIIKTGTKECTVRELASSVMNQHPVYKGLTGLQYLTQVELMKIKGIGRIKAIQLLCVAELSKRMARVENKDGIKLNSPSSIADYFMESTRYLRREQMFLLLFDTKHRLLKMSVISEGTVNASIASPRELLIEAVRFEAVFMILLHNHPSGDPEPSAQDIAVTRRIRDAGDLIGIKLVDHIILGEHCFVSLREQGVI